MSRDERLESIEDASATDDTLVTVAVAPSDAIEAVQRRIEADRAAADRRDDAAAADASAALDRARRRLNDYESVPDDGLVVFAGVEGGDPADVVFEDPPGEVRESRVVRDEEFVLDPLEATAEDTYGLLVVERGGAALGRYAGDVTVVETLDSRVPGKHRAGGQSADRFERRRRERKTEFFETVAAAARRAFLADEDAAAGEPDAVDGLVLGGTEITVEEFREGGYLDGRLADRVVGVYSVEYANEQGLRQLADRATDDLPVDAEARDALDAFFAALGDDEPVAYGRESVERALTFEAVETLLVSEALPVDDRVELEERTEAEGGESVLVPTETDRGERFAEAFGGVGALCRFPIEEEGSASA